MSKWLPTRRKIRFLWQRLTRGWDDSDTWSLDYQIAKFTLPRLKRFKEITNGYPADSAEVEWSAIIDKMIFAMELIVKSDGGSFLDETREDIDKMHEGLELFGTYFRNLWW